MSTPDLYETDFYAWTQRQVELLGNQQWHHLGLPNLIEEIASLGKQQRQELRSCLTVLMGHLLTWEYQPLCRSRLAMAEQICQHRRFMLLVSTAWPKF